MPLSPRRERRSRKKTSGEGGPPLPPTPTRRRKPTTPSSKKGSKKAVDAPGEKSSTYRPVDKNSNYHPLMAISIPNSPRQTPTVVPPPPKMILKKSPVPFVEEQYDDNTCVEEEEATFDLLHVHITIYSLSGIVSTKTGKRKNKKRQLIKGGGGRSIASSSHGRSSPSSSTWRSGRTSATSGLDDSVDTNQSGCVGGAPLTAIVACQRQAIQSKTVLKTFLPSLPLSKLSSTPTMTCSKRYKANWRSTTRDNRDISDNVHSTFVVTRCMQRETYRPNTETELINNYHNETVELQVCLGRGIDMIVLGSAPVVVTGEEEGEVVMNVPARPLTSERQLQLDKSSKRKKPLKGKKNLSTRFFPQDPTTEYSLDDNASLKVGVRVVPDGQANPPTRKSMSPEKVSETLTKLLDNEYVIEIDDENSMLADFLKKDTVPPVVPEKTLADMAPQLPDFVCTPFRSCAEELDCGVLSDDENLKSDVVLSPTRAAKAEETKVKRTEAVVLPLSLVSSVSESLDEMELTSPVQKEGTPAAQELPLNFEQMALLASAPFEI